MKLEIKRLMGFFLLGLCAVVMISMPAMAREKIVVGITAFSDESGKNLGGKVTDAVVNTFVELKYFRVVERNRMDQLMREVAHQQTGFVDANTAVEIGRQSGAQAMVLGSVAAAGYNIEHNEWEEDGTTYISKTAKTAVSLNVRIVQVETGEIVFAETITGNASESFHPDSQPPPENVLIDKAIQDAAYNLYRPIQEKFPMEGYVIKIKDEFIWVDFGSSWGVNKSRKVSIYREGEAIVHPKTGKVLGQDREFLLNERVTEAMEEMCKIKVKKKKIGKIKVGDIVIAKPEGIFLR